MGKQFHKGFRTARYKPDGGLEAGERDHDGGEDPGAHPSEGSSLQSGRAGDAAVF